MTPTHYVFYGHAVAVYDYHAVVLMIEIAAILLLIGILITLWKIRTNQRNILTALGWEKGIRDEKDARQFNLFAHSGSIHADP